MSCNHKLSFIRTRDGNGPGSPRAGPGLNFQARGPSRAETGRKIFRLCVALCIVHGQVITRTVVQNCFVLNK